MSASNFNSTMATVGTNLYNSPIVGLPFRALGATGTLVGQSITKMGNSIGNKMVSPSDVTRYGDYQMYTKNGDKIYGKYGKPASWGASHRATLSDRNGGATVYSRMFDRSGRIIRDTGASRLTNLKYGLSARLRGVKVGEIVRHYNDATTEPTAKTT